jgi:hypothetical protein
MLDWKRQLRVHLGRIGRKDDEYIRCITTTYKIITTLGLGNLLYDFGRFLSHTKSC